MPRPPKVTYEDVARACVRLIGRGKAPTGALIYEEVGRQGSMGTINKHQKAFLAKFEEAGLSMLPSAIPEALIPAVEDIWSTALLEAGKNYSEHESEYLEQISELESRVAEQTATLREQASALDERQRELRQVYEEKVGLEEEKKELRQENLVHQATIDRLRADKDDLNKRLADERVAADRRLDLAAEDWAIERERYRQTIEDMKVQAAESDGKHGTLINYWAKQVDDARIRMSEMNKAFGEEKDRHAADISLERARSARLSQDLDRMHATIEKVEARLEVAEQKLADRNEALTSAQSQVRELEDRLEEAQQVISKLQEHQDQGEGQS